MSIILKKNRSEPVSLLPHLRRHALGNHVLVGDLHRELDDLADETAFALHPGRSASLVMSTPSMVVYLVSTRSAAA